MTRMLLVIVLFGLPLAARSECVSSHSSGLVERLGFHAPLSGALPEGWRAEPAATAAADAKITHGPGPAVRIERKSDSPATFSNLNTCLQMDFAGSKVELRGWLRTEHVQGVTGLWLREDGGGGAQLAFDNMQARNLQGTTDWKEYSVTIPRHDGGQRLVFGAYLSGTGKVWIADLELLVDGQPVWQAPKKMAEQTPLDMDHEFDEGSRVGINNLSSMQVANLVTLGKVWGFLKYYHPAVRAGQRQWDFDLFRILPEVLASPDRASADSALLQWITALGPVAACASCATPERDSLQLRPDLTWITDEAGLGSELSRNLRWIHDNGRRDNQFYVGATSEGNPAFDRELPYKTIPFPDAGYQLLALYRFWNIVEYWYPYRDVIGEDWDGVLADFIPRMALAKDRGAYAAQMMMLIAEVHDSHANLWSELAARPPAGECQLPVQLRYIEDQAAVTGLTEGAAPGFKVGDVLVSLDSVPVEQLVKSWAPYYGASNQPTLLRDIADDMTRGACGEASVDVRRGGKLLHLRTRRLPIDKRNHATYTHDLPGASYRLLSPSVAYLKLSSIQADAVAGYIKQAAGTRGLIIDIRNYPSDFVVFALGSLLVDRETPFARFTLCDLREPGTFLWTPPESLIPARPHYQGKVVILVDEISQSQSEYTAMALRSAPGAVVVGSTTAGADGDISKIALPGGLTTMISGLGVFYPDDKATQRIGILPDVVVRATLAGVRAGRDEVLEKALRIILGSAVPEAQLTKMYRSHKR